MDKVAMIGGGTMGADIAAIFVAGGWTAHVVEPDEARRAALSGRILKACDQLGGPYAAERLVSYADLESAPWQAIALVVECAPEDLAIKRKVFAELEQLAGPNATLASNSSSFPITDIAQGLRTTARMCGLHFFMPAHLVPVVEVIQGAGTDPAVCERLAATMRALGRVPVNVRKDVPGFLVNRIQHAMMRECFALIDQGLATAEDVDAAVRYGFGFRFVAAGPILQKDLSGLDIHGAAAATIYPSLCNDTEPSRVLRERLEAGKFGVKTGEGFYKWDPERIAKEKARYDRALLAALDIFARERGS